MCLIFACFCFIGFLMAESIFRNRLELQFAAVMSLTGGSTPPNVSPATTKSPAVVTSHQEKTMNGMVTEISACMLRRCLHAIGCGVSLGIVFLILVVPSHAQNTTSGSLSGTVSDATGSV